ncbi:hypothetical protein PMI30_06058 [Pseudomonas sp. GM50]|uniref:hypothetical protein n=1 Tax=Pseudomonas sp. GM50 TaxID=1144332 RepID=UPI000270C80C|nr:hypothetical protein [Pseudomonas sp. GM50]EJM58753.1 hypothetical protein PMI30_06058 [Pseudomonas sp. GM50]
MKIQDIRTVMESKNLTQHNQEYHETSDTSDSVITSVEVFMQKRKQNDYKKALEKILSRASKIDW